MATYTGEELSGDGIDNPLLTAGVEYTFVMAIPTNLSGSGYFVMETIPNATGSYDFTKPTNALGQYASLTNIPTDGLITSSYKSAIVCHRNPPDAVSYKFTPDEDVVAGTSKMRSTGGIGLELTP